MTPAPVTLSFDDGRMSVYANAFPVLRERGLTGCLAVVTGFAGRDGGYYSWDQVGEMSRAGWEVLAHSQSHDMWNLDAGKIRREVVDCLEVFRARGYAPNVWISPGGPWYETQGRLLAKDSDYGRAVRATYRASLLGGGPHPVKLPVDPHGWGRYGCECYTHAHLNKPVDAILAEVDRAAAEGQWCHLGWHDPDGPHVETLTRVAERIREHAAAGRLRPATVSEALGLV